MSDIFGSDVVGVFSLSDAFYLFRFYLYLSLTVAVAQMRGHIVKPFLFPTAVRVFHESQATQYLAFYTWCEFYSLEDACKPT